MNFQSEKYNERSRVIGIDPYSKSKIMSEEICSKFCKKHKIKFTVLRIGNIYNGNEKKKWSRNNVSLVQQWLNSLKKNIALKTSSFENIRDWTYAKDIPRQPLGYGYDDGINSAIQVCHLLNNQNKEMSEIIDELPITYQSPTMAPFCKDEEKYQVVDELVKQVEKVKSDKIKIDDQIISEILTVNGIRFSFEDGSWGLIRASSNKPSLVVVTESPTSDDRKKKIFDFIDDLLQKTGKIGDYDQKI